VQGAKLNRFAPGSPARHFWAAANGVTIRHL